MDKPDRSAAPDVLPGALSPRGPAAGETATMADFVLGERVRVRATPDTVFLAGRTGTVVSICRAADSTVTAYRIRLDVDPADQPLALFATFRADQLEAETA